jgi:hypothetical protein
VLPVRIVADAFAPGVPSRDVRLSPDHAVLCAGVLIPVRYLLNGRTVVQEAVARIRYFHVELASHDVLLADGLAAESFLDTGNRAAFAGGAALALHPDFSRDRWTTQGCAPLALAGPKVVRMREQLLRRAAALGHVATDDADLRLLADGRKLPALVTGAIWRVWPPPGTTVLALVSRRWMPALTRAAETDTRTLGVAIRRLWLDGRLVSLDSPGLSAGWHGAEAGHRWTDGRAELGVGGVREVAFELAMTGRYWLPPRRRRVA